MSTEGTEPKSSESTVVHEAPTDDARTVPLDRSDEGTLPAVPPGDVFPEGTMLAARFRIVRLIAHGGMGAVYEAEDTVLDIRVALKTLLSRISTDASMVERFRREVLLARQVTHHNVCRLFELYQAPSAEGPVAFLTMELLKGETLGDRLARTGRLSEAETLPLARQMVSALGAAHAAGVTHRDFKPGNVMLVGAAEAPRVVVTDFGIARASSGGHATLTAAHGGMIGTPAYMAPEQVTGKPVTEAADIYALGVVLFEMLTGKQPFRAETPLATALQRVGANAPAPVTLRPDLSRNWNDTILACLQREPDQQLPLEAVLAGIEGRRAPLPLRWLLPVVAVALLVVGVVVARRVSAPPRMAPSGSTLAVLGFRNISGDAKLDWMSTAVSEVLTTELNQGNMRTVPGEQVARAKAELSIATSDTLSPETLGRLRDALGTDAVLLGTFFATPDGKLRIDARLQDARDGHLLQSLSETGTREQLVPSVEHLGQALRTALYGTASGREGAHRPWPRSPEIPLRRSSTWRRWNARARLMMWAPGRCSSAPSRWSRTSRPATRSWRRAPERSGSRNRARAKPGWP